MSDTTWGASQPTPDEPSAGGARGETAPTRPSMPAPSRAAAPTPIEGDVGEIVEAVTPPENDEIMPTTGGIPFAPVAGRPVSPYDRISPAAQGPDDVHLLGETAIANASMSASGAPTPMAGVPMPHARSAGSPSAAATPPASSFGNDDQSPTPRYEPRYEPRTIFAPVNPPTTEAAGADQPDASEAPHDIATHEVAGADVPMAVAIAAMVDEEGREIEPESADEPDEASDDTAETTRVAAPAATDDEADHDTEDDGAGDGDGTTPSDPDEEGPRRNVGAIVGLVALGVAVWAGAAFGSVQLLGPDPVVVPPETHVTGEPGPTVSPIALEDPTDFLAAMPSTVGSLALTGVETLDPIEAGVPERAAEVYDLQYSDGTTIVTVRAIQHYSEDAATAAYETLAGDASDVEPVTDSEGTEVGERAVVAGAEATAVVWRNSTAVLVAEGPEDAVLELYRLFAL